MLRATNMTASGRASVLGGFSFEAESLPDFSEFDSTSVVEDFQAERSVNFFVYFNVL
ncbi:hypothetical protein R5R35_004422 [Gryllus longicercus]|uniref:Uncharacterized protein n=1 Tax=Gryllus longicercus TaxID=2509291 RepID=A0AAN9Z1N5_9ORTH